MAVGWVSGGNQSGTTSASSLNATSFDVNAGNYGFVVVATSSATTISTSSSGWVQLGITQDWASATRSAAVFYKKFSGSETGTILTINFGASVAYGMVRATYRGVDPTNPIADYAFDKEADASDTTIPLPALSTADTARVVGIVLASGQSPNAPTNFISRNANATNANINWTDIGPDYAAGTLGPWTSSVTAAQHAAWSIALKEDPARREPAWEAASSSSSTASSYTPTLPNPLQVGDLLVLALVRKVDAAPTAVPSNWNLAESTSASSIARLDVFYWVYDGGSAGTFTWATSTGIQRALARFTSPHAAFPVGTISENSGTAGTTVTFPALTPASDGLLTYVAGSGNASALTNSSTTPTNAIERWDSALASAGVHCFGGTNGDVSSGVATSTFTSTLTNAADWAAQTIVLASLPSPPAAPTGLAALVTQS